MLRHLFIPALTFVPASMASAGSPAQPDAAALGAYSARIEAELRGNILPFWMKYTPDPDHGGFFGEVSADLVVNKDAPHGAVATTRILWTFAAAYERYHDLQYLGMAVLAYDDLMNHFWDRTSGGLYWSVAANGTPSDARKEIYIQSFGILGLSEFFRATREPAALEQAIALYRTIEMRARDHRHGGYFEEFTPDWRLETDLGRSLLGAEALKSQNVHLHLLEAYTNLLQVWPDPGLRRDLRDLAEVMLAHVYDSGSRHLRLFLDPDWTPRSRNRSFGHDIEFAWLFCEAANALGEPALIDSSRTIAVEIARTTLAEGVDADGALFNMAGPFGITDRSKDWWPQAEAAVGFLNAYQISGDPALLRASLRTWDFIDDWLVDRQHGGWFRSVTAGGRRSPDPKVSIWNCPYHNGRACMELAVRLRAAAADLRAGKGPPGGLAEPAPGNKGAPEMH
jgi:mannobiose 2-epimerase